MSTARPRLALHRVRFDDKKAEVLEKYGIEVLPTRSMEETKAALQHEGPVIVLVDLSVGGAAPESLAKAAVDLKNVKLLGCASQRVGSLQRRASRIGMSEVYVFPEGAFGAVLRALSAEPGVAVRRISERVNVVDGAAHLESVGAARLVNLSSTGALIECEADAREDEFSIALSWPTATLRAVVTGTVRWREKANDKMRLGIEFIKVDDATRKCIEEFVRDCNVIGVASPANAPPAKTKGQKVKVSKVGRARSDYFIVDGDLTDEAVLVPSGTFFVDFQVGDHLQVKTGQGQLAPQTVTIVGRRDLDGTLGGRIGWQVRALAG